MTKILACVPLAYDATSYYRAYGVFPNLKKYHVPGLEWHNYIGGGRRTWAELLAYDIVFMQRPAYPEWLKLAEYMKGLGKKIWIDHDDNLFELPPYNRVVDTYNPGVKKTMLDMLKLADVVTVSTLALQEYFKKALNIDSIIIPNALNEQLTPIVPEYNQALGIDKYLWRGSETHQGDLTFFADPLGNAMEARPTTVWHYMGYNPWHVTINFPLEKWKYHMPEDIMVYYNNMLKLKPQVMHVPLFEDGLNHCKSNIAWIEATAIGAVTIAPNWHEWQKPGVINYDSIEDYGSKLMAVIDKPEERWKQSRDYILENLTLTKVNQQRANIINKLNA